MHSAASVDHDSSKVGRPSLFLTDADVRQVFDWKLAGRALAEAYSIAQTDDMFPPRSVARGDDLWLRTLTGVAPAGGLMGGKMIAASTTSGCASYLIPLFDQRTTELIALLDGHSITGFRTAATTALAADRLASPGAIRLGVIGSGFEARHHVRALSAVRAIEQLTVFSPRSESRAAFIRELDDLHLHIVQAESAREAIEGACVVLCAARSRDESPILNGEWLAPGMTILSIGSTLPEQREVDSVAISRASLIVADMVEEIARDTGDMIAARADGIEFESRLVSLSDVVSGRHPGRGGVDDIVMYKSVGSALQDIAVAGFCVARAIELGIGTPLPVTIAPVQKGPPVHSNPIETREFSHNRQSVGGDPG